MAIDHTQLRDVPRRLTARPFVTVCAGEIGDRLWALAWLAKICLTSATAPMRRGSVLRPRRR
jgi:hypothetical protein